MAENRAYKLNAQKQPGSKRGTYIYYYYDSEGHLTSAELSTKLFTKMVKMDRKFYNLERREKDHNEGKRSQCQISEAVAPSACL